MKLFFRILIFAFLFQSQKNYAQTIDTVIKIGDRQLHFNIIKGKGIPILFESGAGDYGTIWDSIIKPIAEITGGTLITYDRAGFGKSTLNTSTDDISKKEIMRSYEDLENGLKKLRYDKEIMLVAHSYGGHLATLYAVKHPDLVKSVVLIDVTGNFFSRNRYLEEELKDIAPYLPQMKTSKPAQYNIYINLGETAQLMKTYSIPTHIPVIDMMRESPGFNDKEKNQFWYDCHKEFAAAHPKSKSITAYACQHHIWFDNPGMVVQIISKMYAETLKSKDSAKIYERLAGYGITLSNEVKKQNALYNHSEENLNSWGYELLNKGELLKALEIFKLNVTLHPASFNVYDSYGEALLKNNQKEEAIAMYKKSVELNPGNENGLKVLQTLLK